MVINKIEILDDIINLERPIKIIWCRIDRKIELYNSNEDFRVDILNIHSRKINFMRGIDLLKIKKMM